MDSCLWRPSKDQEAFFQRLLSSETAFSYFEVAIRNTLWVGENLREYRHENIPTRFTIVVAVPEFLKSIERVLSQEAIRPSRQLSLPEAGDRILAAYKAHFSIFQAEHIAAFVDPYEVPDGLGITKVIQLRQPTADQYQKLHIRHTPFSSVQLASTFPGKSGSTGNIQNAVIVATDRFGTARAFTDGKEVLRWSFSESAQRWEWVPGIDVLSRSGTQPKDILIEKIINGLAMAPQETNTFAGTLSTVLLEISEQPGAGALVVLVPKGASIPGSLFTHLLPLDEEMVWAKREQPAKSLHGEFLKSQALMDGALVVRSNPVGEEGNGHCFVTGRQFIMPIPPGADPPPHADWIRGRLDEQIKTLEKNAGSEESERQIQALKKFKSDLPTMGARHRSALLLALFFPDLTVITVSADGPIRIFRCDTTHGERILHVQRLPE